MTKRAAPGTGNIRKVTRERNGKVYTYWEARVTIGHDPGTGKQVQRSITGKTQREVREKAQAMAVDLTAGTYLEPSRMTVEAWLNLWLSDYLVDVKTLTRSSYGATVRNYLVPSIGAVKLQALNTVQIQQMYNHLQKLEDAPAPKTIKNIHGVLHSALKQAVELGFIRFNPSDACKLPRVEKAQIKPLEDAGVSAFLEAIRGHKYERLFLVDLFTGMRQGELLGLRWEDIDFTTGTILVRRQLIREKRAGGTFYFAPLKNDKPRRITPASTVMEALKAQKAAQATQREQAGAWWEDTGLVFTNETGGHLVHVTVYKSFKRIVEKIGLPDTRFHDLRHTFATLSLQSGDDIKTVQENLGHHTASFTMDTYAHVTDRMKRESAQRMEAYIQAVKEG